MKAAFVILLLLILNLALGQSREQDSLALVALYNSTDGANWFENTNWLSSEPIDNWFGITIIDERVTKTIS